MRSTNCENVNKIDAKHESRKGKLIIVHVLRIFVASYFAFFAISSFRVFAIQLVLCIEGLLIEALLDKPAVAPP